MRSIELVVLLAAIIPEVGSAQLIAAPAPPDRKEAWQLPVFLRLAEEPKLAKFYSPAMRARGAAGQIEVDLRVDPAGKVAACEVKTLGADPELAAASCRAAREVRYQKSSYGAPVMPLKFIWSAQDSRAVPARPGRPARLASPPFVAEFPYPAEALQRGEEGRAVASVKVSAEGRSTACSIGLSTGSAILDAATCDVMMRHGRFDNGIDVFGTPIASTANAVLNWRLPAETAPPAAGAVKKQ